MPTKEELKQAVQKEIDARGEELVRLSKTILDNPEPGYREVRTSGLVSEWFRDQGVPYQGAIGITGLKGMLEGGSTGPTVAVMGEARLSQSPRPSPR